MQQLRERVAVAETDIRWAKDILVQVHEAMSGINDSLHVLTKLEERVVSHQEYNAATRGMIMQEREERQQEESRHAERIGNLEILMGELNSQTSVNTHGRDVWERFAIPAASAVLSGLLVAGVMWFTVGRVVGVQ